MRLARLLHLPSRGPRDCTCGHAAGAHEHYRRGTDCALCECAKFRAGPAARPRGPRGSRGARDSRGERAHAA